MKSYEAWRVYGALLRAAGLCIHDRLKIFPNLPSPSPSLLNKGKGKVINTEPNKRKLSVDSSENRSPRKRLIATDGSDGGPSPMQVDRPTGDANPPQNSVHPSSSEQASGGNAPESRNAKENQGSKGRTITRKAILDQIWKDDLDSGRLLVKLHQLYGDRILPFIPSTEMSLFL